MNRTTDPAEQVQDHLGPRASKRQRSADMPYLMADRIGTLYADEERRERIARCEGTIRKAQNMR